MNIIKSSTPMKSNKSGTSMLETECLFGEKVQVLNESSDSVYCTLLTDNYTGWIKKNSLGKLQKTTHRVFNQRTFIYKNKNEKSDTYLYLPMGSKLTIEGFDNEWGNTVFFVNGKKKIGYVPRKHIVNINHKVDDWVLTAQQLEGTPYRWGGRDTKGIDCSALLQLSFQTYGQIIPRNTSQQIKLRKKSIKNISELKRGCVIFWKGHVGIMVDEVNCIHSNAYHMKTITEPLKEIINRMNLKNKIIKMMNFN